MTALLAYIAGAIMFEALAVRQAHKRQVPEIDIVMVRWPILYLAGGDVLIGVDHGED